MVVLVMHGGYGCDTGCCGHWIEIRDDDGKKKFAQPLRDAFTFDHPRGTFDRNGRLVSREDAREFAERIVREQFGEAHVADLDWDNCQIVDSSGC